MVKVKSKIKVFIFCHKPVEGLRWDDVYTPMHIGRVMSTRKEEMRDYLGDDTGDNISDRDVRFSEVTGLYWIWKNVHDVEYVGSTQYRRDFDVVFKNENVDQMFAGGYDVIFPAKNLHIQSRWHYFLMHVQMEDYLIMRGVMKKQCPEYLSTLNSYLRGYYDYPGNMLVCRKVLYDKYAEWLFGILFEMEKYVRYSGYTNSSRVIGYIAELLTPVYFLHHHCKIKECAFRFDGKLRKLSLKQTMAMWFLQNTMHRVMKKRTVWVNPSFYRGLKMDGIDLDCT